MASKKSKKEEKVSVDDILEIISGESIAEEKLVEVLKVLQELIQINPDIKGVIIASMEGFPIASYPEDIFREEARVSAAIAAIFATSERNALDLVNEHVNYIAIKTSNRYIILRLAEEDHIIAVITDEKARLGMLLRDLSVASEKLKKIFQS